MQIVLEVTMVTPTRPELAGHFGMVAATHWLAAATGMGILEKGGNAFDAAVASGLVLQVVEPHLNGPGGEVPIMIYEASTDKVSVICGQGPLPGSASIDRLRSLGLVQVPGTGLLPACVPGAFGAWMMLLENFGQLELEEVLAPAIAYAVGGFRLLPRAAATIAAQEENFRQFWPTSAEVYLGSGMVPIGGKNWSNPLLGATYQRLLVEAKAAKGGRESRISRARDIFYQGFVAEAIDSFVAKTEVLDDSGHIHGGMLNGDDLATWYPTLENSVSIDYHNTQVHKTGPWGQGPVFLQQLRLLEGFDLKSLGSNSPKFVHIVTEAAKLAFADRDAFYGDPNFVEIPMEHLLSRSYANERRTLITDSASYELRPGSPGGYQPWIAGPQLFSTTDKGARTGAPPDPIGRDTCHLDVADRYGNLVAATPSGGWLHGSPCVPGLGFSLSTRGQMCWLDENSPSAYVGGRRPRTTLTPTLTISEDGRSLAFGTPGGDQQDQWSLAFFLRSQHFGMNLQEAIDAPTFHTTHLTGSFHPREARPGRIHIESRIGKETLADLRLRGHDLVVEGNWSLGRVCAVGRSNQELSAGADARQDQAYAVGR